MKKIELYGAVDDWMAQALNYHLYNAEEAEDLEIYVSSLGGSVFLGIEMFNKLKRHKGKKTCYVDSLAGSIMSVIPLACDEVVMNTGATLMIHNPLVMTVGDKNVHKKSVEILDKCKDSIISIYKEKLNLSKNEISKLMDKESWYTAEEAVALGWADRVASVNSDMATIDNSYYQNIVAEFKIKDIENRLKIDNKNKPQKGAEMNPEEIKNLYEDKLSNKQAEFESYKADAEAKVQSYEETISSLKNEISTFEATRTELAEAKNELSKITAEKEDIEAKAEFAKKYSNFVGDVLDKNYEAYKEAKNSTSLTAFLEASFEKENQFLAESNPLFKPQGVTGEEEPVDSLDSKDFGKKVANYMAENKCDAVVATKALLKK